MRVRKAVGREAAVEGRRASQLCLEMPETVLFPVILRVLGVERHLVHLLGPFLHRGVMASCR